MSDHNLSSDNLCEQMTDHHLCSANFNRQITDQNLYATILNKQMTDQNALTIDFWEQTAGKNLCAGIWFYDLTNWKSVLRMKSDRINVFGMSKTLIAIYSELLIILFKGKTLLSVAGQAIFYPAYPARLNDTIRQATAGLNMNNNKWILLTGTQQ